MRTYLRESRREPLLSYGQRLCSEENNGRLFADNRNSALLLRALLMKVPRSIRLSGLFGSFAFLQFTVLGLANHAGEGYLTAEQRDHIYYALQVFVILGYLLYSLFFRFREKEHVRNTAVYCGFGLFTVSVILMFAAGTASLLHVIVSMAAALSLGAIGGMAHHRMSLATVTGANVARYMGFGSAGAVALQYLLQIHRGVTPLLPVFMLLAFLLFIFLLPDNHPEAAAETAEKGGETPLRRIVSSVLIASAFILFTCFYNESIHHLMIQSDYTSANVYSWPRLMLIPGYLLFAWIGDRDKGKCVPIASLCIMLIALLNVVLFGNSGTYWLNMCLFYFAIAAHTCYYLLTFWRLAPGTRYPAFWAPFGRMLDSAMVLFTGAIRLSELPLPVVMGVDIAGIALVILLMAMNGDFNLSAASPAPSLIMPGTASANSSAVPDDASMEASHSAMSEFSTTISEVLPLRSPEEALEQMRERYGLTGRETEVLRELVLTEDKQTVISDRLSIKVKTLQDYVTRLYRKTGAVTRSGLTDLYYDSRQQSRL